ncbi:copper-binding protein [Hydrogenophaga sp. RWCD_12]|uniref:copper-binding protein n=1 Tax=Hydrogenophaga sp. RWCD_12 TaxID=3391190 RepID=UPI003985125B
MKNIRTLLAVPCLMVTLAGVSPTPVMAQNAAPLATTAPTQSLPQVDAEIRKIDSAAGKVTLKHGDIPNLDMPGMTMVFQLRDPAQLTGLKVGDKVRFRADQIKGTYTVVDIVSSP